jgi:hypothetical protein
MFEVECAYRRVDGGIKFIREERMDENRDDLCAIRVSFAITEIYPPEKDTGASLDYQGDIAEIAMRRFTGDWKQWRFLRGEEFEAAKLFLLEEHAEELWQAAGEVAEAEYFGEAA